jgi:hypothetical protein
VTLDAAFAYYAALGRRPGWAAYAIEQARTLAADHPVLYADLPAMLTADNPAITQQKVYRVAETKANTYRLEASRFSRHLPLTKGAR